MERLLVVRCPGVSPAVSSSSRRGGGARYESVGIEHVRTTDELCHHNARPRPAGSTTTGGPAWSWAVSAVGSSWVSCEFAGRAAGSWTAGSSWVSCEFAGRAAGSWAVAAVGPSSVSRELADGDTWFAPRHACRSHADVQSCVLRFRRRPPVRLAQHAFQRSGFRGRRRPASARVSGCTMLTWGLGRGLTQYRPAPPITPQVAPPAVSPTTAPTAGLREWHSPIPTEQPSVPQASSPSYSSQAASPVMNSASPMNAGYAPSSAGPSTSYAGGALPSYGSDLRPPAASHACRFAQPSSSDQPATSARVACN